MVLRFLQVLISAPMKATTGGCWSCWEKFERKAAKAILECWRQSNGFRGAGRGSGAEKGCAVGLEFRASWEDEVATGRTGMVGPWYLGI